MKWADRALVISPYYFGLCLTEKDFHRELRRLKVPRKEWPPFLGSTHANATAHFLEHSSGKRVAIVALGSTKGKTIEQVHALLVHEAVHIWQECRADLGERAPSSEFEAYSIQSIAQGLMVAWADQGRGRR